MKTYSFHTGECPKLNDANTIKIDYSRFEVLGQPPRLVKGNYSCKYANDCSFEDECPIYQEAPKCLD